MDTHQCCMCGRPASIILKRNKKWYCELCIEKARNRNNKPIIKKKEQSRNDQCNCGSGKKYKYCCLLIKNKII